MTPGYLLLPLDDRPVNLDLPVQLAAITGETLVTPSQRDLGRFLTPGAVDQLAAWLVQAAPAAHTAILSLDMLAYGGLVASRTPEVSVAAAVQRLEVLREIKRRHPALRIYAFNVIMRLTITGTDPAMRAAGKAIFRYSILRDQVERLGEVAKAAELTQVATSIPSPILDAYLAARARNHAVNRAALALLADGVVDFLALVQEDTAPVGLHVPEQQALRAYAAEHASSSRWRLYAGADEAAQTLLARAILEQDGRAFPMETVFRDALAAETPALYEDTALRETTRRQLDAAGGTEDSAGVRLAVHTFTPPQEDLFERPPLREPTWRAALSAYPDQGPAAWLAKLGSGPVALADVAYCNGGDPHLLAAVFAADRSADLWSYAGWNTAGNTLGTTIAQAALRFTARARGITTAMEAAQRTALFTRVLDDVLFQSIVRPWAIGAVEESGGSALNLGSGAFAVEQQVDHALRAVWGELCARYPAAARLDQPFRTTLPWGRLFEIRIITEQA